MFNLTSNRIDGYDNVHFRGNKLRIEDYTNQRDNNNALSVTFLKSKGMIILNHNVERGNV